MDPIRPPSDRLESWKEIAAYLGRTEKTARRWEQSEGLPVHRLQHAERGSVYAFRSELDQWRASRTTLAAPREGPAAAEAAANDAPAPAPPAPEAPPSRRWWPLAGVVLIVGAGILASRLPAPSTEPSPPPILAVLPFAVEGGDTNVTYLGRAVAESLAEHLAGAPDLRLRPFASSLHHSRDGEPAAVGRRMGADQVATGRIVAAGEGYDIRLALVDVTANTQTWAARFQASDATLASVQLRMALDLREAALRQVRGAGYTPVPYQPSGRLSDHPEATRLYLRARDFPRNPGRAPIETAINLLSQAIEIDPDFAAAYAYLATAHVALSVFADRPAPEINAAAERHAWRALALDPRLPYAHQALAGVYHWHRFDHAKALEHYRIAESLDPASAGTFNWLAETYLSLGRFDEAEAANRRAAELFPGWLETDTVRGNILLFQGRAGEALTVYQRALDVEPNHGLSRFFRGQAYLALGRTEEAVAELRRAHHALGRVPFSEAGLAHALARAGETHEAGAMLDGMLERQRSGYYPAFAVAIASLGFGRLEDAMTWIERACDEGAVGYYLPGVEPHWAPLRTHPRWPALQARLGLPAEVTR